jgi:putative transposase
MGSSDGYEKTAAEISREYGISKAAFYKWRQRYGGMNASESYARLKDSKKKSVN